MSWKAVISVHRLQGTVISTATEGRREERERENEERERERKWEREREREPQ